MVVVLPGSSGGAGCPVSLVYPRASRAERHDSCSRSSGKNESRFAAGRCVLRRFVRWSGSCRGKLVCENFKKTYKFKFSCFILNLTWPAQGSLHSSARIMRGHVAYWDSKKKDARAHICVFGPMSFFLTLNPAERRWTEITELYCIVRSRSYSSFFLISGSAPFRLIDVRPLCALRLLQVYRKQITPDQVYEYICKDPYWFARCFQRRVSNKGSEMLKLTILF